MIWGLKMPPKLLVDVHSHHQGNEAAALRPEQPPLLALSDCPDTPLRLDAPTILMHPQLLTQDAVGTEGQGDTTGHTAVYYLLQQSCIQLSLLTHIRIIFIIHTSSA